MTDKISGYYDENIEREKERLHKSFYYNLEKKIILHLIRKYFPQKSMILDVGGGPGIYSGELLKMGFDVTLIDISKRSVEYANNQFGSNSRFQAFTEDARDLSRFKEETFDYLLIMGPFYHLLGQLDRLNAVRECRRVLGHEGRIIAAAVSFYGAIREVIARRNYEFFLTDEVPLDPMVKGYSYVSRKGDPFIDLYMTRPESFQKFFENNGFRTLSMAGSKGFFAHQGIELEGSSPEVQKKVEAITLATCEDRDIIGLYNHLFYVGEKC